MKINNKFLFVGIAVILLFVAIYQYVKSDNPVEISEQQMAEFSIYGKYYEGDWKSEEVKDLFESADILASEYDGISSAVYYNDPYKEDGLMKVFIGVMNPEKTPQNFEEIREFNSGKYLKGKISNDYFQIPQRIYMDMEEYAEEKNYKIGEFSVEQYFSDSLMIVFIPIFEK